MATKSNSLQSAPGPYRLLLGLRNRHFFALDLIVFCITPVIALWLRTDGLDSVTQYLEPLAVYTISAIIIRFLVFASLGLYSRYWRYASIDELAQIFLCLIASTAIIAVVFFGMVRPLRWVSHDFPRSIPFLDGILVLFAVGGTRYSIRLVERIRQRRQRGKQAERVLILGAGDAGAMIVKELQANPQLALDPVAFLDDDPGKHKTFIHGVQVVGECRQVRRIASELGAKQAIIAMPTASGKTLRQMMLYCQEAQLAYKTIPGVFELLDGTVSIDQLRPVDIADLLRRESVKTDMARVTALLRGKRILITGAGGSIGSELARQIAHCHPAALVLLGHGENSIVAAARALGKSHPELPVYQVIADIRDLDRLRGVFARYRPQVVFHAAAHKHVPLMEENVEDAVTNNVLGTRNVIQAALACGVESLVSISTDKAVNPTNVMGATKYVAELLVKQAAQQSRSNLVVVRFGNVLGSRGSVVPLFKEQIAQGGPVTVTDPQASRYFMTIPEAVQLVLQAAALGKGGETFVLDMGEPIKIVDLARDLIRLSGMEEGRDIDIVYTGLRPGEKLDEELFAADEKGARTSHQKIFVVPNGREKQSTGLPYPSDLSQAVEQLIDAARRSDQVEIYRLLRSFVPSLRAPAVETYSRARETENARR
jgi:FlaA1/EpsC-like NDP-sugar epimerase